MDNKIEITETTLRDGQQSLWATRMTTAMLLPILPVMDRAGFASIECYATVVMDACVRYLRENPWERLRLMRERVHETPLGMMAGCVFSAGSGGILPDDLSALLIKTCARNGIDQFFLQDGLNDPRNLEVPIRAAKEAGARVLAASTFSISPVHTDEHFVERVPLLKEIGADVIVLKDPNGLLTPERARTLVPALRAAAGDMPVYCHSHCVTGMGPAANLEAVQHGAAGIWTAAAPLANGSSLPATESMLAHLRRMGYQVDLDEAGVAAISEHFLRVAKRHGKPVGAIAEYDPSSYQHQMPGGMISNFRAQLAQLGIGGRLDEVLAEIPPVREDLGWALMVTPYSQIIATQAALNVLYGRYEVVPEQVKKVALGYYGRTPAPVSQELLDRIAEGERPVTQRAGELVPHVVDRMREQHGRASDEDLILRALFMPDALRRVYDAGPIATTDAAGSNSVVDLVREVAKHREVTDFSLVKR